MVPITNGRESGSQTEDRDVHGLLEYYSMGVLSFLVSGLLLALFYHPVVAMAQSVHLLSTTVIVFVFLAIWAATWLVLELVWEWRGGRLSTA